MTLKGHEYLDYIKSATTDNKIKTAINSVITQSKFNKSDKRFYREKVLENLREEGVIDVILEKLIDKIQTINVNNSSWDNSSNPRPPDSGIYLNLSLLKLANISQHLLSENEDVNSKFEYNLKTQNNFSQAFEFHISFRKQRLKSDLIPCHKNIDINQLNYLIKLTDSDLDNIAFKQIINIRDPIHLILIKHNFITNERLLISSQTIEWKTLFSANDKLSCKVLMDLFGVYEESKMKLANLELGLELIPHEVFNISQLDVDIDQVISAINAEDSERHREFILYTRQWWAEYLSQDRPINSERYIKLFAQDENNSNRFLCDYLVPLRAGRLLDSPCIAVRFVASIPLENCSSLPASHPSNMQSTLGSNNVAGGGHDIWSSSFAVIVQNKANSESHAVLLCSLLLGFGLDAYVAIGTVTQENIPHSVQPHVWVVVLNENQSNQAWFYEPCLGKKIKFQSYPSKSPTISNTKLRYKSIGCLFNHFQFYANNGKLDIEMISFDLQNQSKWKSMSSEVILSYTGDKVSSIGPLYSSDHIPLYLNRLVANNIDTIQLSNDLENQLRHLIGSWRYNHCGKLATNWDDQLCYILGQSLWSYEQEQITGQVNVGNLEFKQAIQRHIPDGFTFKAFPLHVLHLNARQIFDKAFKSPIFQEIINCHGSQVRMTLRVRVFNYAEYATPTWIVFGCVYMFGQ